jgi:hypothetical protein
VEIKEDPEADAAENQVRFALIRELLHEHGLSFSGMEKIGDLRATAPS